MKRFRKEKIEPTDRPAFVVRILVGMNTRLLALAAWLGQKTITYSAKRKKVILFGFCTAFVSQSIYVVYQSFQKSTHPSYSVAPIRVMPLQKDPEATTKVAIPELERIHHFKTYLDSLSRSEEGRVRRDSFLAHRPHLMDTVLYLETIYNEQLKSETNGKKQSE